MEIKEDQNMENKYLVVLDAKQPAVHYFTEGTDDFKEVELIVSQWLWTYSDGHIWVYRKTNDGDKVIKHIILKA